MGQLHRVNTILGVKESFKEWMTHSQGMKGKYKVKDPHLEQAKSYLREFYERPNKELYKLLDEVGLGPFTPFDSPPKTVSGASSESNTTDEESKDNQVSTEEMSDTGSDEASSGKSEDWEQPSDSVSIPKGTAAERNAIKEEKEPQNVVGASVDSNLIVLGRDVAFHKKPVPEAGFISSAVSRSATYFFLTLAAIGVVLWIMQSSRQRVHSRQLQ